MSMVKYPPNVQIYDPRLGQDFVLFTGRSKKPMFSSLEHGLYVVEAVGQVCWATRQDLFLECILKTSIKGFFTVVPWYPGAKKLKQALLEHFSDATEIDSSVVGYFDPSPGLLSRLFSIRDEYGGESSGEWCIGGCSTMFSEKDMKCNGWNINCVLSQAEKIGCILSLEEMRQSHFMVKWFDELPKIIDAINRCNLDYKTQNQ